MTTLGTSANPLRVAIVGSGPSGFYAADYLEKKPDLAVEIDMFDRLPTPYGLVRGGVAPDHQKIKSVTKVYEKIASNPSFRFYGNVKFGTDITHDELLRHYHAVIYTVGAQTDKRLDIPGEDLPGSLPATEFVAWYNGHPDYRDCKFDLSAEAAAIVGIGNVAMDVARILARSIDELKKTDMADYAIEALEKSNIKTIYILGRRGPVQAAFTDPEIKEMGEMEVANVVVGPDEVKLDPASQAYLDKGEDAVARKNMEHLRRYAENPTTGKPKKIMFRFCVSPVELTGNGKVEAVKIVKNELYQDDKGNIKPRPTDQFETLPVGMVFRSVGYRGVALPGVPFNESWGTIPNDKGRILTAQKDGQVVPGEYVSGWIKRGPSGVIGTNKPDSVETTEMLLEDMAAGKLPSPDQPNRDALDKLLAGRGVRVVTYADWQRLDQIETARGAEQGRPRVKFTSVQEMLDALAEHHQAAPAGD
jgi:ferredoxin--NADP+ reductase